MEGNFAKSSLLERPQTCSQWTLPPKLETAKQTHQKGNEDCVSQQGCWV